MADSGYEQPGVPQQRNPDDEPKEGEATLTGWVEQRNAPNLAPWFIEQGDLGKQFLGDLAKKVCDETTQGWDESADYRERRKEIQRLYTGFLKKKTFPFDGCANVHSPLLLERILRLAANVYAEIFSEREMIFGVKATGPDDYETAEVLTVHGNWQLRNQLTDFLTQMDKAVTLFFLDGSVLCYSWYDNQRKRNRHDILTCEDVVLPYTWQTDLVDLGDVPWKTRIVRKYKHELDGNPDGWAQLDVVLSKPPPAWDFMETKNRDQGAAHEGIRPPEGTKGSPYLFYEYHGWARMPGGQEHLPICITVSADHKVVTKLYIRDEEDWEDRDRFDRQMAETEQYQQDVATFPQRQQEHQMQVQAMLTAPPQPQMDPMTGAPMPPQESPPPPTPPQAPAWAKPDETGAFAPEPARRVPVEMFSHGRCAYNPGGMLGLSYGDILATFNTFVDEALNRFYDAATLNNVWSIILGSGLDLTTGLGGSKSIALRPGTIFKAQGTGSDDLQKSVKELRPAPPSTALMEIVRYADEGADAAVAAPGILSGEPGKSGEAYRGAALRNENAKKQLTSAGSKFLQFLEQILRNNARLNWMFGKDEEIVQVNNHLADYRKFTLTKPTVDEQGNEVGGGEPLQQLSISRDMYRRNYDVSFTADVRFTSQAQKIAEADEVLAMVNQVFPPPPIESGLPDPMAAIRYAAVAEVLRARGKQDLIPLLGPAPQMPPVPMGTPIVPPPAPPGAAPVGPDGQPLPPEAGAQPGAPPPS